MKCAVAVFIEGSDELGDGLVQVFEQHRRVFRGRDIHVFAPPGHPTTARLRHIDGLVFHPLPAVCCTNIAYGDSFKMTEDFYECFRGYDYVLLSSVHTWPLYDALDWWMEQGFDYVAAPWMDLAGGGSEWVRNLDEPRGGRGGASLRHMANCREYVRRLATCGFDFGRTFMWDDLVLSGGLPNDVRQLLPKLRLYPRAEQARFAWDKPHMRSENLHGSCVDTLLDITRGHLPMLLYSPSKAVVDWLCVPEDPPEHVFLFSSATKPEYDYKPAVERIEPDPAKRLLVYFNDCESLFGNLSSLALVRTQRRILTFHNDTVAEPFGPSNFGEVAYKAQRAELPCRVDQRTLSWRPILSRQTPVSTYDGEIVDGETTEALRSIGSEVPGEYAPTSGYMAYAVLRRRYPSAKIHFVNFFGNTRGFQVCVRHDVSWEQAAYRRDPLTDFVAVQ